MEREQQEVTAERVGRNDARFRRSNEELALVADSLGVGEGELRPFLCECADLGCTQVVQLTDSEYESVRRSPIQFINALGHERNGLGWVRVVDEFDRYTIVEKIGAAAEVAAELDPRSEASG